MVGSLFGAVPGEGTHLDLGRDRRILEGLAHDRSEPAENETERIETIPGLLRGNQWKSTPWTIEVGPPETTGENAMRKIAEPSPPYILQSAPRVLKRFQYSE